MSPAVALLLALVSGEPSLVISVPTDDAYVSGNVTLKVDLRPEDLVLRRMTFGVDGRVLCAVERPPFECAWDAGATVSTHDIRVVAELPDGRRLVAKARTRGSAFAAASDADVVQVAATVLDKDGKPMRGLTRESFRVFEDGVEQPLTHFIGPDAPNDLVVAVDTSASMGPSMPVCRDAVKAFLSGLRPDDHLTLLAFNDNLFTLARRETDPAARLKAVERLTPWGGTSLYDVTLRGLQLLGRQGGRHALVAFTDGEDTASHATAEDVDRRVQVADVPIYVIAQGRGVKERPLRQVLNRLADLTGGRAFYTQRIEELQGAFAEIAEDLASQYVLGYEPQNLVRDGSWRTIRVEVVGTRRPVRARQGYRAEPPT